MVPDERGPGCFLGTSATPWRAGGGGEVAVTAAETSDSVGLWRKNGSGEAHEASGTDRCRIATA